MRLISWLIFFLTALIPVASEAIDLKEAIDLALKHNPRIKASLEEWQAERARIAQQKASYLPRIEASGGLSHENAPTFRRDSWSWSVTVRQEIADFGQRRSLLKARRAGSEAKRRELLATVLEVIETVKTAYYQVLYAQKLQNYRKEDLQRAQVHLAQAKTAYELGSRPKIDLTQARVDLARSKQALIKAQSRLKTAWVDLNRAVGVFGLAQELEGQLKEPQTRIDFKGLLDLALANNQTLKALEASLEDARHRLEAIRSEYRPRIYGEASYGEIAEHFPLKERWRASLNLTWPLFTGGEKGGRLKEALARLKGLEAQIADLRLEIRQEVEKTYYQWQEKMAQIKAASEALAHARENYDLTLGRYQVGAGSMVELLDAQTYLSQAESDYALALFEEKVVRFRLERLSGRLPSAAERFFKLEGQN
ncbi:TolC family protein [Thermosulfuriphilus sp.]